MFENIGFTQVDDFRNYKANAEALALAQRFIDEGKKANREFMADHKTVTPTLPISGSFIYGHPANYRGRPTLHYTAADWRGLFVELKAAGMDMVIFQAAAWLELESAFYPSSIFGKFKTWNVIEPMLEAAGAEGMTVFLGGMGSATGWKEIFEKNTVEEEKRLHIGCYKELAGRYGRHFHGFYFAPETIYMGRRDTAWESTMNGLYSEILSEVKSSAADKLVLMSPGTRHYEGREDDFRQSWLALLKGVPLDIMAPQDSIGTCMNNLQTAPMTYQAWRRTCDEAGIRFWSNIEIFERKDRLVASDRDYSVPADFRKVYAQMEAAEPHAEKLICWEAPYYLSEKFCGTPARELREKLQAVRPRQA